MSTEKLVFQNTVESLARFLRRDGRLTPGLDAKLKAIGLDFAEQKNWPQSVWMAALRLCADELFPDVDRHEAERRLGQGVIEAFIETTVGTILFTTVRILGVKRGLNRLTGNFRSANNYTETSYTEVADGEGLLQVSDVNGAPGYIQGVLEVAIRSAGAKQLQISLENSDGLGCTYRVKWE